MFSIAFLVGLYAKGLFILGLLQLYTLQSIVIYTIAFILAAKIAWQYFDESIDLGEVILEIKEHILAQKIIGILLLGFLLVIVTGVLIPETAFDSLWYHLTLPKLYLLNGGISFIPGTLFYYSTLPKIGELLYLIPVGFHLEQLAKIIQAIFALLTCIALYLIARYQTNKRLAFLSVVIFLSNIVVLWQATTAYIDLIRTFFETLSLYGILLFGRSRKRKWIVEAAVCMGLAIETKLISLGTLVAHSIFIMIIGGWRKDNFKNVFVFICISLLMPLPWFVFSVLHTGNPIYPIFSGLSLDVSLNPLIAAKDAFFIFIASSDPLSPIYIAAIPLIPFVWKRLDKSQKNIFVLAFSCFLIWMLTPRTGGGRFIMSYLPLFSLCVVIIMSKLKPKLSKSVYFFIIVFSFVAIFYRGLAQVEGVRAVIGLETKAEYLTNHLNYNFGDFYDIDGYFRNRLQESDKVLLVGFHNLYYVDFPFIDRSYLRDEDIYSHVATQNADLPDEYADWILVYSNSLTHVDLYQDPEKGLRE